MSQTANIKQSDTTPLLSATKLKACGWTDSLIRYLLGLPYTTKQNPRCRSGVPIRLYDISRVRAIGGVGNAC